MIFKTQFNITYCKTGSYQKKFDNNMYFCNDDIIWYFKGYLVHREDGPAIEWRGGNKEWFLEGKHHQENGPAIEYSNGDKYWYLNGIQYLEKEYMKIKSLKSKKKVLNEI